MSAVNPPGYNEHLFEEQRKQEEQQKNSGVKVNGHQPPSCGGEKCCHGGGLDALKDNAPPLQPM